MALTEGSNSKRVRRLDLFLSVAVTGSGALFFLVISRSIEGVANSVWLLPFMMAVFFIAFLSLFSVTVGIKKMIVPIVGISFLPSVIFMPVMPHIFVVFFAIAIAIHGLQLMRQTLFNTLKIDIRTIVRSGISYMTLAVVLVITSQYYFSFKQGYVDKVFDASKHVAISNAAVDFMISQSNIKNVSVNTMTVDDFLAFVVENSYTQEASGPVVNEADTGLIVRWANNMGVELEKIQDSAEEQMISQMRGNISKLVRRDVQGDELLTGVFSEVIEAQIATAMAQNPILRERSAEVFTFFVFLILFSLTSFVRVFANWVTRFIFMILREFGVIKVEKIQRDAEVIIM